MAVSPDVATGPGRVRDHGFHPLRVKRVVRETEDTVSVVLDVPDDREADFTYSAGQFLTFRVPINDEQHLRSYSMSSSPDVGDELQVTVKRVDSGVVSNWFNDALGAGDTVQSTRPAGHFCLDDGVGDFVGFAGGSGITPVISLMKTVLARTSRRIRLLYANRDRDAVIFAAELDALAERHPGRVEVVHHFDSDNGFVDTAAVDAFVTGDASYYICGPGPFMELVERALEKRGVDAASVHIERFTPVPQPEAVSSPTASATSTQVTVELEGETKTAEHRPGTTILQTARQMGLKPPYSCEAGDCATCMARLVDGKAEMRANNALFDDEVSDGWVLTCQAVPETSVHVVYES